MKARPSAVEGALLWPEDVAAILGMGHDWPYVHQRELCGFLVGNKLRFTRADVDAYVQRQRAIANPEARPTELADEREQRRPAARAADRTEINPVTRAPYPKAGAGR